MQETTVKREIRNRFKERVKDFKQNSESFFVFVFLMMKIGWKMRKVYDSFRKFSRNISGNIDMNMQISELMMS